MKKILILLLLGLNLSVFAQKADEIKVQILKSKLVDNESVFGIRQLKVTSDDLRKVMIKTKISSSSDNKAKLSAFSLLDTVNKIRYRLADYKGYMGFIGYPELIPFIKTELFNDKGKKMDLYEYPFDPTEKDYFYDYNKEGYKNLELPINFGTTNKPKLSIVYFGETEFEKFTAELFFAIIVANTNAAYELHYKNEKISDIKFE